VPDNVKKIVSKSKLPLVPAVSELEPTRLRELSLNNAKTYGEEYSEIEQEDDDNMTQSEIDGYSLASTSKSSDLKTFLDVVQHTNYQVAIAFQIHYLIRNMNSCRRKST
jgi:hypothetical protein